MLNWRELGRRLEVECRQQGGDHGLFTDRGWRLHIFEIEASQHGLPQWRRRAWIVAVHCGRAGVDPNEAVKALKQVEATVRTLGMERIPLSEFVLSSTDPYIQAPSLDGGATTAGSQGRDSDEDKWRELLLSCVRDAGYSWRNLQLPKEYESNAWVQAMSERERTEGGKRVELGCSACAALCGMLRAHGVLT